MPYVQSDLIEVKRCRGKGNGVFARRSITSGTVIERVPILVLPGEDVEATPLAGYCFIWGRGTVGLALGYGSIYNHSYSPNAECFDVAPRTKVFRAVRDISMGEEITINYNGQCLDDEAVGFEVL